MILFNGVLNGRIFLGFGLTDLNLERLPQDPIFSPLEPLGLMGFDLLITYGFERDESETHETAYMVDEELGPGLLSAFVDDDVERVLLFMAERENQRNILGIGVTAHTLDHLRSGARIVRDLTCCHAPEVDALLFHGVTEDALQRRVESEFGILPREVKDFRTPAQRKNPRGFGQSCDRN